MDVRKTVTDAGYIAIGLGVMGYQQAQIRRRELTEQARRRARPFERARPRGPGLPRRGQPPDRCPRRRRPRPRRGPGPRRPSSRVQELGDEVAKRVEPVVDQVQAQLGELPERVVQVIEPVAARVRERTGSAA